MLVLRRQAVAGDRSILCLSDPRCGEITVTVLAVRGELVDLAVSAPAGTAVEKKSAAPSRRLSRSAPARGAITQ